MEIADKKKRKVRRDKGVIRATDRDMACIAWIAEQYAARGDQIQVVLSWYPDPDHPMQGELVSQSTTREQISRWVRAGWVVYKRVLAQGPGWAYVTRAGLHLVGLDDIFKPHPPSEKMLSHIFAVNQVRLWMDEDELYPEADEDGEGGIAFYWKSERRFRATLGLKRGESSGPIPDAVVYPDGGDATAIEVQISLLTPSGWVNKFRELLEHRDEDGLLRYSEVWVYVPTAEMEAAALKARGSLDDQGHIEVIVQDDLLMEERSWF